MAKAQKDTAPAGSPAPAEVDVMFHHPGFLIRRAQQIAVSSFFEHYGVHGITPTQSAILKVVQRWPGIDQVSVGRVLGLDRTTAATSVATLAADKLLDRRWDPKDRRRRTLFVTPRGEKLIAKLGDMQLSAQAMLGVFSGDDARTFMRLLEHFVISSNDSIRIPMETSVPKAAAPPKAARSKLRG
jgi:DNA-binding MarR family transcriptional regulator